MIFRSTNKTNVSHHFQESVCDIFSFFSFSQRCASRCLTTTTPSFTSHRRRSSHTRNPCSIWWSTCHRTSGIKFKISIPNSLIGSLTSGVTRMFLRIKNSYRPIICLIFFSVHFLASVRALLRVWRDFSRGLFSVRMRECNEHNSRLIGSMICNLQLCDVYTEINLTNSKSTGSTHMTSFE